MIYEVTWFDPWLNKWLPVVVSKKLTKKQAHGISSSIAKQFESKVTYTKK
ncbi:MAG: hypothetical protein JKY55_02655 [Aliivibrio sp.]|nr:hypothetical protein [Aliivibrio sp.]